MDRFGPEVDDVVFVTESNVKVSFGKLTSSAHYHYVGRVPSLWKRFWYWLLLDWHFEHLHTWGQWTKGKSPFPGATAALRARTCTECRQVESENVPA